MRVFFQHVILTILLFYTNSVLGQEDSTSYAYFSNGVYTQFHGVQSIRPVYGGTRILAEIPDSWDEAQQGAFRYACDLWEEVLPSTFPIRIRVQTQSLNSNISEGSVLSRVSPVSLNVGIYSTASYKPQISAVTFMEMVGKYQSHFFSEIFNSTYFVEPDIIITYYEYNDKKFQDIYSFSLDETHVGEKYDFITCVLRDIAKGLGFKGTWRIRNGVLEMKNNKILPYEKKILSQLELIEVNGNNARYEIPVSGQVHVWNGNYVYAPNPWDNDLSLNYFVPSEGKPLSQLLDWNYGKGSVIRSISDVGVYNSFQEILAWKGDITVGTNTHYQEDGTSTANAIPYGGTLIFGDLDPDDRGFTIIEDGKKKLQMQNREEINEDSFVYANKIKYHPALRSDGSIDQDGHTVAFMRKDGTWDVVFEDNTTLISGLSIDMSTIVLHGPDSVYARNYDGKYRCRVCFSKRVFDPLYHRVSRRITTQHYLIGALPQAVKSNMNKCQFKPEYDDPNDEFTGVIQVPMKDLEGVTSIVVAQYDAYETIPYYYVVTDFKDGYFLASVDKEFDTRFVITAYNENGYTESEAYTFHPSDLIGPMALNFTRRGDVIEIESKNPRARGKNVVREASISSVLPYAEKRLYRFQNENKLDVSKLKKASYVLNVTDINGDIHSYKFVK